MSRVHAIIASMVLSLLWTASIVLGHQLDDSAIVGELRKACIPLAAAQPSGRVREFAPLAPLLKGVTLVGMGECTHGSREVFQLKHRMFQFLVERLGYTVLELEASMPACVALDRYVLEGEGDPTAALKAQGFWTWSTEEVLELIKWMRAYNVDPRHTEKLRVIGVDMQDREGAIEFIAAALKRARIAGAVADDSQWFPKARYKLGKAEAIRQLDAFVVRSLPEVENRLGGEMARFLKRIVEVFRQADVLQDCDVALEDYLGAREDAIPELPGAAVVALEIKEDARAAGAEGQYALDLLILASKGTLSANYDVPKLRMGTQQLRDIAESRRGVGPSYDGVLKVLEFLALVPGYGEMIKHNPRDVFMAENAEWVIKALLPNQKAMLWAHNYHIARTSESQPESCGRELTRMMGDRFYPLGISFGSGAFQAKGPREPSGLTLLTEFRVDVETGGTLDRTLGKVGPPAFFIDLGSAPLRPWANTLLTTRNIGASYNPAQAERYVGPVTVGQMYRGLIYIAKTTRARPL